MSVISTEKIDIFPQTVRFHLLPRLPGRRCFSMQVIQTIDGKVNPADVPKPTNEEMQNEYDYLLAEQLTRKLLDEGHISVDEFNKIMAKNRETFSPYISKIIP